MRTSPERFVSNGVVARAATVRLATRRGERFDGVGAADSLEEVPEFEYVAGRVLAVERPVAAGMLDWPFKPDTERM